MENLSNKVILFILDGWGINPNEEGNATLKAKLPFFNNAFANYPSALISASSESVGLTHGEMGNSEVGHMNLGSGRVVWQDLALITRTIENETFFHQPALEEIYKYCKTQKKKLHLIGLVSDGGVHSYIDHLIALLTMAKNNKLPDVFVHAITDGRDSGQKTAKTYFEKLEKPLEESGAKIATVSGRYFAMDRDERWDRTKRAYEAMVFGVGRKAKSPDDAINSAYVYDETDEFIIPSVICDLNFQPIAKISNGDAIIFFNFRKDRMRQLMVSMLEKGFSGFKETGRPQNLKACTMARYKKNQSYATPVFEKEEIKNSLSEVISKYGLKQLHIAETEKYAHVTYFFNGGREKPFPGEDRIMVPSPKVSTYDKKPEMSAEKVTEKLIANISKYDFIVVNFANPDMVGHTGDINAAVKALETVDSCMNKIAFDAFKLNMQILITADHGNVEQMISYQDKSIETEHSINLVPLIYMTESNKTNSGKTMGQFAIQPPIGILADIAPTILELMNIPKPDEMTGQSLVGNLV